MKFVCKNNEFVNLLTRIEKYNKHVIQYIQKTENSIWNIRKREIRYSMQIMILIVTEVFIKTHKPLAKKIPTNSVFFFFFGKYDTQRGFFIGGTSHYFNNQQAYKKMFIL